VSGSQVRAKWGTPTPARRRLIGTTAAAPGALALEHGMRAGPVASARSHVDLGDLLGQVDIPHCTGPGRPERRAWKATLEAFISSHARLAL
jgi:hypothetical protein